MTDKRSLFELLEPVMKQVATQERINDFFKEFTDKFLEGFPPDDLEMQDMLENHKLIVLHPGDDEEGTMELADDVKELIG